MRKYIAFILLFLPIALLAQEYRYEGKYAKNALKPLTHKEREELKKLPELRMNESFRDIVLPYAVDNSENEYFRNIFCQSGLDCGQAASVAIGYTYEVNRLRDIPSNTSENLYTSYFPWNWENGGNGWYGASYYHSMEVLRKVGCPSIETYGGTIDYGGGKRWMSGYDSYYAAMHNRIRGAYSIKCDDEESLNTLKHWIDNHCEDSDIGGVGFFYSQYQSPSNTLPNGTEEAGKHVITSWGASPNHGMAICGYNDSIRWDYNGDGEYTNDEDITGDGQVDMRDWEIGALKMCNTYHSYPDYSWGDQGFAYMMYRGLALDENEGGIWNNTVNVLKAKETYEPQLTMKVYCSHDTRNMVKITAGMTTDLGSDVPEIILDFPIFDYQGADWGMQGELSEIEFGLDITPFLNYLEPGEEARFILQVEENDPSGEGTGEIFTYSVMDYTSGTPQEISCASTDVGLVNDGITRLGVNHTVNYDPVEITTETLPEATLNESYSHALQASGGTQPYTWYFDKNYEVSADTLVYPTFSGDALSFGGLSYYVYEMPFDFPFYDSVYSYLYITKDGFISPIKHPYNLPYDNNDLPLFLNIPMIAPMFANLEMDLGTMTVSAIENSGNVVISWESTGHEFSVRLNADGSLMYYYGANSFPDHPIYSVGISSGEQEFQQVLKWSNRDDIPTGLIITLNPFFPLEGFELSEEGDLTAYPTEQLVAEDLQFLVVDDNNLIDRKTIPVSTDGLLVQAQVHTANNDSLEVGEEGYFSLYVLNQLDSGLHNIVAELSTTTEGITITQDTETLGELSNGESMNLTEAFIFDASYDFENADSVYFTINLSADEGTWSRNLQVPIYAPLPEIDNTIVSDGDDFLLDPGETTDFIIELVNVGGSDIENAELTLSSEDAFVTVNNATDNMTSFMPGGSYAATFNLSASGDTPDNYVAALNLNISGDDFDTDLIVNLSIGQVIENWESGDTGQFPWFFDGDANWFISEDSPYEGNYCLQSGDISDSQESVLELSVNVLSAGNISFYRKVSCETSGGYPAYDFLSFYIDGAEQIRWHGETDWASFTYPLDAGHHLLEWKYEKDLSVSSGSDCAWIDFINFPPMQTIAPEILISTDHIEKTMQVEQTDTDTIFIENLGGGLVDYSLQVLGMVEGGGKSSERSLSGSYITCSDESYIGGGDASWEFTVYNGSGDNEWIKQIMLDFPTGVTVNTATDFIDQGNDSLYWNGIGGNGVITTWFNETENEWGIIVGEETAESTIDVSIDEELTDGIEIEYQLGGDIYGSEPHNVNGNIVLNYAGTYVDYLTPSPVEGTVGYQEKDTILLHWDTHDMLAGHYEGVLKIFMNIDSLNIPVDLYVQWPVGEEQQGSTAITCYPNPSQGRFYMQLPQESPVLRIYDIQGRLVWHTKSLAAGTHIIPAESSPKLDPGAYFMHALSGGEWLVKKVIVRE